MAYESIIINDSIHGGQSLGLPGYHVTRFGVGLSVTARDADQMTWLALGEALVGLTKFILQWEPVELQAEIRRENKIAGILALTYD